jgi:hypothetical protein
MAKKAPATRRPKLPPIVAAVVLPVAKRLARMEALLIEMRHEQDVKLKKLNALEIQLETLTEHVRIELSSRRKL